MHFDILRSVGNQRHKFLLDNLNYFVEKSANITTATKMYLQPSNQRKNKCRRMIVFDRTDRTNCMLILSLCYLNAGLTYLQSGIRDGNQYYYSASKNYQSTGFTL